MLLASAYSIPSHHMFTLSLPRTLLQGANNGAATAIINVSNATGWTPLHFAAKSGHLELMQYLLNNGADPFKVTSSGDDALNLACTSSNLPMVDVVLAEYAKKAAPFCVNHIGLSPVTIACKGKR